MLSLALVIVLLTASLLCGCSFEKHSAFDAVGEMLSNAKEQEVMKCEVVYPKGSSADVVMAARELASLLEEQTEMSVTSHRYEDKYDSERLYVVIGRVSDDVTEYWYDGMGENDYVCRVYKNTVTVGGVTDSATLEAIQRFIDEILPAAEYGYIAEEGILFEHYEDVSDTDTDSPNGYGLAAASYRINKNVRITTEELKAVSSAVKQSGADIITVRVANKNAWNAFNAYFYEDYNVCLLDCEDGSTVAVLSRPKMTAVDFTEVRSEKGIAVIKITVSCLDKKYDVLSLYPSEEGDVKDCAQIVDNCFASAENPAVCIIATSENDVTVTGLDDTEEYLLEMDSIISSGTAKYRICVLTSSGLDCYDKIPLTETDGRYVGACVSVRDGSQ